ncbi:MAG: hypothetical protein UZ17_ACD001002382 [Acidobacteria bacterium OLB17]|nr:MAG: hypothetical protein UZ17_ACD001002382 [Acidobacteria bacterium OLB17]
MFAAGAAFVLAAGAVFAFAAGAVVSGAVLAFAAGAAFALAFEFAVVEAGASAGVAGLAVSTDTLPLKAGIEISNAETINTTAATIVIFERIVVVPRGVNAELEILLVNKAPASVFPGCRSTAPTSTMHETKNKV